MSCARVIPQQNVFHFLASSSGGAKLTYAVGSFLPSAGAAPGLRTIRAAYNNGDVELVQRRREDGELDYVAIRRRLRAQLPYGYAFPRAMCG